jgi:hypothetical protein
MTNMCARKQQNFFVRPLAVDQHQLGLMRPQFFVDVKLSVRVGHKLALKPVHRVPILAQIICRRRSDHPTHGLLGLGQHDELFVGSSHAGSAVGGVDVFGGRVERFEIRQEARCWWFVRQHSGNKIWVSGEQFERNNGSRAVADHGGRTFGREVLDEKSSIVRVGLETLRVVLRASQVALREASS